MNSGILLYFGSFNPIHKGHLSIARSLTGSGLCDELWFVVSPSNPLKDKNILAPAKDRLEMARIAVNNECLSDRVKICDIELDMPTPSFTYNTITELKNRYPDTEFMILMGEDNIYTFDKWYKWKELLNEVEIIIYPREDSDIKNLEVKIKEMASLANVETDSFTYLNNAPLLKVSSTQIRERIKCNLPIDYLTTTGVEDYIKRNKLYGK